jgi:photosystem II stability/assembly factor-like uncharacterized protein
MAGGSDSDGNAVFLATDDGGESWTALPGPDQLGSSFLFLGVSCATGQSCVAVGEAQAAGEGGAQTYDVVVTTDGGQSWSDSPLPAGFVPGEVQCLASERCIVGGFDAPSGSAPPSQGAGLYSIDGGSTWTAASVPAGVGPITTVSCSDEVDCVAVTSGATSLLTSRVVVTADGGQTWTAAAATGLSGDFLQDVSCPTASYCWAAGIQIPAGPGGPDPTPIALSSVQGTLAMTDDGGQTWQAAQLPTDLSNHSVVTGVACPTSTSCFATVWLPTASLQGGRYVLLSYDSSGS